MNNIVYHGTTKGDLEIIKANKSTHNKKCVYATENETVALLFISHGRGDLDTIKMNNNGVLTLIERREGIFKEIYNTSGYIYSLPSKSFNHYDYLWNNEVISFEDVVPIKKLIMKIFIMN